MKSKLKISFLKCHSNILFNKKLLLFIICLFACMISFYTFFRVFQLEIGRNDFTNWMIMCGTIASAIGLVWFSSLTYKNQKNNEFYALFNVLLNEHNQLLDKIKEKPYSLHTLNKAIIGQFSNFTHKLTELDQRKLGEKYTDDKEKFHQSIAELIDTHFEFKPYLITLYRLLDYIYKNTKIDDTDKKECYGLVRGLLPSEIQFLVLFNAIHFDHYQFLIVESKLLEHLPITENWLRQQAMINSGALDNPRFWELDKNAKQIAPKLKNYILSTELIPLEAFGSSIYLKQST